MSREVKRRRGTTIEHSTFTGALGETTIDTDKKTVVVHDGATAGGFPLARQDGNNTTFTKSDMVRNIVLIWEPQYAALATKDAHTLYIVVAPSLIWQDPIEYTLTGSDCDFVQS